MIYLQPECCADPFVGRAWCHHDAPVDCPDGVGWTPYVRADELAALQQRLATAAEALHLILQNVEAIASTPKERLEMIRRVALAELGEEGTP